MGAIIGIILGYLVSLSIAIPQHNFIVLFFLFFGIGMFIHVVLDAVDWSRDGFIKYIVNGEHHEPMKITEIINATKIKREEYDEKNVK